MSWGQLFPTAWGIASLPPSFIHHESVWYRMATLHRAAAKSESVRTPFYIRMQLKNDKIYAYDVKDAFGNRRPSEAGGLGLQY